MKWVNLLFITLLFLCLPSVALAAISKINFVTDSQSVALNNLSEAITIQAQDSAGNPFETSETLDLAFSSNSLTGEFLGSSGSPATKTMNKNTANRTFYYRDSVEGSYTITVTATGRDSGLTWSANQSINIGKNVSSSNNTKTSSGASATSAPTPVSKTVINPSFEIYAGESRLTAAGSPIVFQVLVKKTADTNRRADFSWSFGDGSVGGGSETTHTYKHPGTYAVVVSSKSGGSAALSRISVKVVEPSLKIFLGEGFVEIENKSEEEINLFNWALVNGIKKFIFQPDTIIFPHTSVRFDNEVLRFDRFAAGEVILVDSLGRSIASSLDLPPSVPAEEASTTEDVIIEEAAPQAAAAVLSEPRVLIYEEPVEEKSWWRRLVDFFGL